ncbi:MAG: LD-carboxypeptidase [Oscillospiraceae bacterium]|nr:LD-carboxypeptidase [Oscillospiraceae bacterium]
MKAAKLKENITIGVFSSSSPISATVPTRYQRGKAYLESKGLRVIDGSLFGKQDGYRSGSIQERAREFNQLLYNDEVRILMASIGGNNSNSILPYIDYDYLRQHPKVIIGYSDTTALLLGIYARTGLVTFYGPALASSFGEFPPFVDRTFESFKSILLDKLQLPYEYKIPAVWTDEFISWNEQDRSKTEYINQWITVCPGACEGRLIGGNLNTMQGIFGTEYMPEIKQGDILLLEDSLKDAATIERSFSLLKLAGVFDKIGGIILGKHEQFDDNGTGRRPYEILMEVMGQCSIPFLAEFDCCHTHPMFTMPIGCQIQLDATNRKVTLLENPLTENPSTCHQGHCIL